MTSTMLEEQAPQSSRGKRIRELYDEVSVLLQAEYEKYGDDSLGLMGTPWDLMQYDELHRLVDRLVPVGGQMLDWGAGVGHFAYVQQRLGREVTAYTLQPSSYNCYNDVLASLADRAPFRVSIGTDPVTLPFPDASFDSVVSCGVLEHVREFGGDDLQSLGEIRRILRPGGVFVCMHLPNRFSWIEWSNRVLGTSHHRFTYTRKDIDQLLANAKFELRSHHRYGVLPKLRVARLLGSRVENPRVVDAYYLVDSLLGHVAGLIAQNHIFVAERV